VHEDVFVGVNVSRERATARVPGFDCASGWAESAHYRHEINAYITSNKFRSYRLG
jgi:hypothetical protein